MRRYEYEWASLLAQTIKKLPAMQDTRVSSLGQEDPLEKEMSINFPGESHRQRSLASYSPWGQKELDMIE